MKHVTRHFKGIIHALFWEVDYKAFEVFNGITILILGISFFFLRSAQGIIERSTDDVWGINMLYPIAIGMIMFGLVKVYAISRNKVVVRKWIALVGTFMWGFLFVVFLTPPIKPSSVIFILVLIGFSMWAYIRLVLEHRGKRLLDPRDSFRNL